MKNNISKNLFNRVTERHKKLIDNLNTKLNNSNSYEENDRTQIIINKTIEQWVFDMKRLGLTPVRLFKVKESFSM